MRRIVKTPQGWALDTGERLRHDLNQMLTGAPVETTGDRIDTADLLAPIDDQQVWAAGVTYSRSLEARMEESREPDVYDRVYAAERPELFFKSLGPAVVGPGQDGGIRADSTWDVPEPEVGIVIDSTGRIFGYTVGDDLSSRSIEGENPLYLPQAKVYDGACVLGPGIVLADDAEPPFDIALTIDRNGATVFEADTSTSKMTRTFEDLAGWLRRAHAFPDGVVLLTGTGVVPAADVTLEAGDTVTIEVTGLGTLTHGIRRVG